MSHDIISYSSALEICFSPHLFIQIDMHSMILILYFGLKSNMTLFFGTDRSGLGHRRGSFG